MRIVAGKLAGRDLTAPHDFRVRPTAEHVRAALLAQLRASTHDLPPGAHRRTFEDTAITIYRA